MRKNKMDKKLILTQKEYNFVIKGLKNKEQELFVDDIQVDRIYASSCLYSYLSDFKLAENNIPTN